MSNVIIGIIGVILFIGLALAGASFLGSTLTDGRTQADAVQVITSSQQMATAARLYRVKVGKNLPNAVTSASTLVTSTILKAVPGNPIVPGNVPFTVDQNGAFTSQRPGFVLISLGQSERALKTCIEIEIQSGSMDRTDPAVMKTAITFASRATTSKAGCHRSLGAISTAVLKSDYLAYFPV